jgi:hypothetical protein
MSNCIGKTINYFNPFSNQFKESRNDFSNLTLIRKIAAVAAGIFGGLITPFLLFTGSVALFQFAVKLLVPEFGPDDDRKKMTGFCKYTTDQGVVYKANFFNGMLQGQGKVTYTNGDCYEGEFLDDIPKGKGKVTYTNGDCYEGEFLDGIPQGQGKITYKNRNCYEGNVVNGLPQGQGKITYKNEVSYAHDTETINYGQGAYYEGNVVNGIPQGKGRITFGNKANISYYYVHSRTGKGVSSFSNGDCYEGNFVNGIPQGQGKITYIKHPMSDKIRSKEGEFVNGTLQGNGTITYIDGEIKAVSFSYGSICSRLIVPQNFSEEARQLWLNT